MKTLINLTHNRLDIQINGKPLILKARGTIDVSDKDFAVSRLDIIKMRNKRLINIQEEKNPYKRE